MSTTIDIATFTFDTSYANFSITFITSVFLFLDRSFFLYFFVYFVGVSHTILNSIYLLLLSE